MDHQQPVAHAYPLEERYRNLINNLSGVFSAKVTMDEKGEIREIHVLADSARNVKQVVRDVRSALFSFFDLDIDHRLISVAQMKENPISSPDPEPDIDIDDIHLPRLRCGRVMQSREEDSYSITVTLKYGDLSFDGSASSYNTEKQRHLCIAQAVLAAVNHFLGRDDLFSLMAVKRITSMPIPICMVLMEFTGDPNNSIVLVGAAEMGADEAFSIERATLDAINRKIPLYAKMATE
ncbi:hypothetical protein LJC33_05230 [Eubacteriales bacterium OttesenSCG-928-N13]|nr:hypothetical protein [Eubacteriales bacterium OttesenSCG-928-N13]